MQVACRGSWLVACSLLACGGAPKTKPLSADSAKVPTASRVDVAEAPVPAPAGLIAVGRARDYRQWVKLEQASPVVAYLKKKLVEEQGDALLEDLDLTQPVEFIAAFDRNFQRTPDKRPALKPEAEEHAETEGDARNEEAPEARVDSIEDHFLAAFSLPLTRYAPESYERLGFKRWTSQAYERGNCLVTPALGGAKARLICGDAPDVTFHLYRYLARGLPLEPLSPAPLFVELRPKPLRELWGPAREASLSALHALAENGGNSSRLIEAMTLNVVKEADAWVASAETLRFEAGPNERGEFQAKVSLALGSPQPWLVESSLESAAKIHGAPSAFSNLPKDVGAAWYGYGMPAERIEALQWPLVNLAKVAFQEFGPGSRLASGTLSVQQAKIVDRLVPELISALDSPCIRAEQAVFANIPADPSEINAFTKPKQAKILSQPQRAPVVPLDVIARATLGQYLVAVPSAARCTQFSEQWVDMLTTLLQALPPKEKRQLPLSIVVRRNVKLKGLSSATVTRISLTKQAVTLLLKELDADGIGNRYYDFKPTESAWNRWGAPQGPMTLSLIAVPAADATGSDWFGLGFDEQQLLQALVQATHPVPGQTLATRAELAPLIAQNPTSLGFQTFEAQSRLMALMGGPDFGPALAGLQGLFHGTSVVTTTQVQRRGAGAEAGFSYYLSKEALAGIRQILSLDIEQILGLAKIMNQQGSAGKTDSSEE